MKVIILYLAVGEIFNYFIIFPRIVLSLFESFILVSYLIKLISMSLWFEWNINLLIHHENIPI